MEFESYAQVAVEIVNRPLDTVAAVGDLLRERGWSRTATPADVAPLQAMQAKLTVVVESSAAGDGPAVVRLLNGLLSEHPIRPQISGHDAGHLHLHVSDEGAGAADVLIAEALFGLALLTTELGPTRLGRCAAPGCGRAYLDASHNRSRRYCSSRCSSRVNVAAHRRRHAQT